MLCSIPHAKIDKRPTIINFFQIIKKRGFRGGGTLLNIGYRIIIRSCR